MSSIDSLLSQRLEIDQPQPGLSICINVDDGQGESLQIEGNTITIGEEETQLNFSHVESISSDTEVISVLAPLLESVITKCHQAATDLTLVVPISIQQPHIRSAALIGGDLPLVNTIVKALLANAQGQQVSISAALFQGLMVFPALTVALKDEPWKTVPPSPLSMAQVLLDEPSIAQDISLRVLHAAINRPPVGASPGAVWIKLGLPASSIHLLLLLEPQTLLPETQVVAALPAFSSPLPPMARALLDPLVLRRGATVALAVTGSTDARFQKEREQLLSLCYSFSQAPAFHLPSANRLSLYADVRAKAIATPTGPSPLLPAVGVQGVQDQALVRQLHMERSERLELEKQYTSQIEAISQRILQTSGSSGVELQSTITAGLKKQLSLSEKRVLELELQITALRSSLADK